jgi:hypothetical protein
MSNESHIASLIGIINDILSDTANSAREAHLAMQDGDQNLAMGSLLPLQEQLTSAQALYQTANWLHCRRREG